MALKDRTHTSTLSEREIEEVISRGGTVAASPKKRARTSNFPLRFMQDNMAERIDLAMGKRPIKPSMNVWINEAILDKLKHEE